MRIEGTTPTALVVSVKLVALELVQVNRNVVLVMSREPQFQYPRYICFSTEKELRVLKRT